MAPHSCWWFAVQVYLDYSLRYCQQDWTKTKVNIPNVFPKIIIACFFHHLSFWSGVRKFPPKQVYCICLDITFTILVKMILQSHIDLFLHPRVFMLFYFTWTYIAFIITAFWLDTIYVCSYMCSFSFFAIEKRGFAEKSLSLGCWRILLLSADGM